jgi:hypothetical protein
MLTLRNCKDLLRITDRFCCHHPLRIRSKPLAGTTMPGRVVGPKKRGHKYKVWRPRCSGSRRVTILPYRNSLRLRRPIQDALDALQVPTLNGALRVSRCLWTFSVVRSMMGW